MSRKISQRQLPDIKQLQPNTGKGKLIMTSYQDKEAVLLIQENRLVSASFFKNDSISKMDAVYIGKVKNVVKNINACFVEISDNELCFLSFDECRNPYLLNREYDGRILQGDEIVVQVVRDAIKTKQAALTTMICIQTEFFVIRVGVSKIGLSTQFSHEERKRLTQLLTNQEIIDDNGCIVINEDSASKLPEYGVIVRTKASELNEVALKKEYLKAYQQFEDIFICAPYRTCFSCLKAPNASFETVLKQYRTSDYDEIITDLRGHYELLIQKQDNVRYYDDEMLSLSKLYGLEKKIEEALSRKVWLKCGGNLIIESMESLTAIDVNSGKCVVKANQDEVAYQINLEAAKEVALQMKLRNLSGIIIVDFINMQDKEKERELLDYISTLVSMDKIPTKVIDMTPLGLIEITRKKVNKPLKEQLYDET